MNKELNKKSTIYLVMLIALVLILVAGATYAYFLSSAKVTGAVELGVSTAKQSSFTSSTDGNLAFKISIIDMDESGVSQTDIANATATLKVDLSSNEDKAVTKCDYDIVWIWDSKDRYTLYDVKLPYEKDDKTYPYEFSVQVSDEVERDLSSLNWNGDKAILASKTIETGPGDTTSDTYEISAKMYNIPVDQQNLFNKNFKAHIQVENVNCVSITDTKMLYYVHNNSTGKDTEVESVPKGDYKLNTTRTSCKKGGTITGYNSITGELTTNISIGDECDIYFDELEKIVASGGDIASSYDGKEKKISVSVSNVTGYEVYYSLDEELTRENYQLGNKTNPGVSTRGTTKVYWCAVKENYATYCSNNTITIGDGIITGTSNDYNEPFDGNNHSITIDITSPSNTTLYYSTTTELTADNYRDIGIKDKPERSTSGTSIVYWCATADNYTPLCGSNSITISNATMSVTGTDYTGEYDGNSHSITVNVTEPTTGYKTYYSTTQLDSTNYTSGTESNISIINASETPVYWCAVADNYTPVCSNNKITITKAYAIIGFANSSFDINFVSYVGGYAGSTTYEYNGDGVISCSSNIENLTCIVDSQAKTITIKIADLCNFDYKSQVTINASEGINSFATLDTITFTRPTCLDPETLVDYWDKKRKKKLKKKIKKFKPGDIVYSYDYASDTVITRKVTKVTVNKANEIYHLILDDEEIKITGDHPVCVDGAGYLNVSQLKPGYKLLAQDGSSYEIKDIYIEILDKEQDMYCLELENGTSLSIGKKGLICLSMFVSVSFAMMKKASALVGVVYDSYSYNCLIFDDF